MLFFVYTGEGAKNEFDCERREREHYERKVEAGTHEVFPATDAEELSRVVFVQY